MFTLRPELAEDWWEVEALYDTCFGPGRSALSSYRLRDGVDPIPELCVVACDADGIMGGAIRYWPAQIGGKGILLLGPIAVHPTAQGEGLGSSLIRDTLLRAEDAGYRRVLLVGDAPYYKRFGFERLEGVMMPPPTNPDRVLGIALAPGAWDGVQGPVRKGRSTGSDQARG